MNILEKREPLLALFLLPISGGAEGNRTPILQVSKLNMEPSQPHLTVSVKPIYRSNFKNY